MSGRRRQSGSGGSGNHRNHRPSSHRSNKHSNVDVVEDIGSLAALEDKIRQHPRLVIDFYATWCPPCKAMAKVVEELAKDPANAHTTFVKVNVDNVKDGEQVLADPVTSMPTFALFVDGQETERFEGANKSRLLKIVKAGGSGGASARQQQKLQQPQGAGAGAVARQAGLSSRNDSGNSQRRRRRDTSSSPPSVSESSDSPQPRRLQPQGVHEYEPTWPQRPQPGPAYTTKDDDDAINDPRQPISRRRSTMSSFIAPAPTTLDPPEPEEESPSDLPHQAQPQHYPWKAPPVSREFDDNGDGESPLPPWEPRPSTQGNRNQYYQ